MQVAKLRQRQTINICFSRHLLIPESGNNSHHNIPAPERTQDLCNLLRFIFLDIIPASLNPQMTAPRVSRLNAVKSPHLNRNLYRLTEDLQKFSIKVILAIKTALHDKSERTNIKYSHHKSTQYRCLHGLDWLDSKYLRYAAADVMTHPRGTRSSSNCCSTISRRLHAGSRSNQHLRAYLSHHSQVSRRQ